MTVARTLKENDWLTIRTRYESGEPVRKIAKDIGISHTTIMNHAKKHGWSLEIAKQLTVIKEDIHKMKQVATSDQLDMIGNAIKQEVDETFELAKHISNLHKGALNLHNFVLKDTISRTKTKEVTTMEAVRLLQMQGLSVDKIGNANGLGNVTTAIQNNVNVEKENPVKFFLPENKRFKKES